MREKIPIKANDVDNISFYNDEEVEHREKTFNQHKKYLRDFCHILQAPFDQLCVGYDQRLIIVRDVSC